MLNGLTKGNIMSNKMSNKIYFSDNNVKGLSWLLTRFLTSIILLLPKQTSLKIAKQLLLKPARRRVNDLPRDMQRKKLSTDDGNITIYRLGFGPQVLLSHGWSGAANQLFALMRNIADRGYQAVAYDQAAHGASSGDESNLFVFIKTQQRVIEFLEQERPIKAVIAHSMGATAALNALTKPYPLLLIAPVFNFAQSLYEKVEQSGVPRLMLENIMQYLEAKHAMQFENLDPKVHLAQYRGTVHIVHDQQDQFAPLVESKAMATLHPNVNLTVTNNLGHGRIIRSEETWQVFQRMMEQYELSMAG